MLPMRLPWQIRSERLVLRPPRESDLAFFANLYGDAEVVRYLSFRPVGELEEVRRLLLNRVGAWRLGGGDLEEVGSYIYVLTDPAGEPLGVVGVSKRVYGYELSYALARAAWGHGYTPEAVRALSDWLLDNGAWRVFATCHVENRASQRTLEKAGFERECRMRRYFTFPNLGPRPADGYLYARVKTE